MLKGRRIFRLGLIGWLSTTGVTLTGIGYCCMHTMIQVGFGTIPMIETRQKSNKSQQDKSSNRINKYLDMERSPNQKIPKKYLHRGQRKQPKTQTKNQDIYDI